MKQINKQLSTTTIAFWFAPSLFVNTALDSHLPTENFPSSVLKEQIPSKTPETGTVLYVAR